MIYITVHRPPQKEMHTFTLSILNIYTHVVCLLFVEYILLSFYPKLCFVDLSSTPFSPLFDKPTLFTLRNEKRVLHPNLPKLDVFLRKVTQEIGLAMRRRAIIELRSRVGTLKNCERVDHECTDP